MIEKIFDDIKKEGIDALMQRQVREKRTIEYKQALPNDSDEQKREFLADVSSFANASGGDVIYGVSEEDGIPKEVLCIQGNIDAEVLRLESIARTSISPRIPALHIRYIEGFSNGGVIVIRIGKSWASPHMVTLKNLSRFYTRNSAGKYQMDVSELRSAFLLSDSVAEKIKQFRNERLTKIVSDEIPMPLEGSARLILHVLPISAFASNSMVEVGALYAKASNIQPLGASGYSWGVNIDGFITFSEKQSYCQIYRKGQIESVTSRFLNPSTDGPSIPSVYYETAIVKSIGNYINLLKSLQISSPIVVAFAMLGVKGARMAVGPRTFHSNVTAIDRDLLILPDILMEDFEAFQTDSDVAKIMRPAFDVVWNACGYVKSFNFDESGDWKPKA